MSSVVDRVRSRFRDRGSKAAGQEGRQSGGQRTMIVAFLFPAVVFYMAFFVAPTLASVWISFNTWPGFGSDMTFVGLRNYASLMRDPTFWDTFWNMLQILALVGASVFIVSFFFMTILREMRGRKFARAVIFFPNIVAPVALGIAWGMILNPERGLINVSLRGIGLDGFQPVWLGPDLILPSIMAALVWIYTGFFGTMMLAAIDRVPEDFYEVLDLDGASGLQKFRYVTLPMTWDVVSVAAVLWVITAIKIFEFIYAFGATSGSPPIDSWTTGIFMYMVTLGNRSPIFKLGYGSAIAVVMLILTAVLVILLRRLMRREEVNY